MSSEGSEPALIGVDWGTSSFRAFLMDRAGALLDMKESDQGILHVQDHAFEAVLMGHIGRWLEAGPLPVVISGMITSRNGWLETPYVELPAGADKLAGNVQSLETASGLRLDFISGLTTRNNGVPDVMRGEETQIVGAVADGLHDGVVVMPGTHSKWLMLSDGVIDRYATFMTGEIFAALRSHTILGKLMTAGPQSPESFLRGVAETKSSGTELLHTVFSARTRALFGELAENETSDYLSGLLIGAEIQGAIALFGKPPRVWLVGRSDLVERYEMALDGVGIETGRTRDHIAALGQHAIARARGLI